MHEALAEVQLYYSELEHEFSLFMEELKAQCAIKLNELYEF
jgi:hypothetical protein